MWEKIADPAGAVWETLLLGVVLSCVYDLFRVRRALLPLPAAWIFAEDVVYCLFSASALFWVLMDVGDGSVRWWLLLALAVGWLVWHFTLGFVVVTAVRLTLRLARWMLWLVLKYAICPIRAAFMRKKHTLNPQSPLQNS